MSDKRYVYGVSCTWNDSIDKVGNTTPKTMIINGRKTESISIPCCPFCGSVLFELSEEKKWWDGVEEYNKTHPGYKELMLFGKGKCFRDMKALQEAFDKERNGN